MKSASERMYNAESAEFAKNEPFDPSAGSAISALIVREGEGV